MNSSFSSDLKDVFKAIPGPDVLIALDNGNEPEMEDTAVIGKFDEPMDFDCLQNVGTTGLNIACIMKLSSTFLTMNIIKVFPS